MVSLDNVSAGYRGVPVIHDVSLDFAPGRVTVLLGPNGCGKSTLLKCALGLVPTLAGTVAIDGDPLACLTPAQVARRVAYLAQDRPVPNITAERMVLHGRFAYLGFPRRYRRADHEAVARALAEADASDLAGRRLPELSGGQRQKVYLAMALAQDTPAILMDEPTSFLDVAHQIDVMASARRLASAGRAVGLVSHDLCQALVAADVVALMRDGRIVATGPTAELVEKGLVQDVFGVAVRPVATPAGTRYYLDQEV